MEALKSNVPSHLDRVPMGNWVDQRIKIEGWQIRILSFDEHNIRSVVPKIKEESAMVLLLWPNLNASLLLPANCVLALTR